MMLQPPVKGFIQSSIYLRLPIIILFYLFRECCVHLDCDLCLSPLSFTSVIGVVLLSRLIVLVSGSRYRNCSCCPRILDLGHDCFRDH